MGRISSVDMNRMIRACNNGEENPIKDRKECKAFFDDLMREKNELEKKHPGKPVYFALVEPDDDEMDALMSMMPD